MQVRPFSAYLKYPQGITGPDLD